MNWLRQNSGYGKFWRNASAETPAELKVTRGASWITRPRLNVFCFTECGDEHNLGLKLIFGGGYRNLWRNGSLAEPRSQSYVRKFATWIFRPLLRSLSFSECGDGQILTAKSLFPAIGRGGECDFWRRSTADSLTEGYISTNASRITGPINQQFCFTESRHPNIVSAIASLLLRCSPSAVIRGVSGIVIDPINLQTGRIARCNSPIVEDGKALPFLAYRYSTTAPIFVSWVLFVLASGLHSTPDCSDFIFDPNDSTHEVSISLLRNHTTSAIGRKLPLKENYQWL